MHTPLVSMVMPEFTKQFKAEATWGNIHRNAMTVYKTNGMRIVRITLHQETILKKHTADDIISVQVLEGKIFFTFNNIFSMEHLCRTGHLMNTMLSQILKRYLQGYRSS